jgi:glycosyltransferase involved in cell wall biosynthesis
MKVLFVHQSFPAQFRHIANALAADGKCDLAIVTDAKNAWTSKSKRVSVASYKFTLPSVGVSDPTTTAIHRLRRGEAAAAAMRELKRRGFTPDVILGHPGWGELMFAKDVFPTSPMLALAEYYYAAEGADVGFDPEFAAPSDGLRMRLRSKNIPLVMGVLDSTVSVAPTQWQASRYPPEVASKIRVIHEGIRTELAAPNAGATFQVGASGRTFRVGDEVITFVNRNLEPMRGYHIFMRALPHVLAARPNAQVVIVGGTDLSYSPAPEGGQSWKDKILAEVADRLPMERVHFVGRIPYRNFIALMQVSALHVYATYPFVLSWSMLEAMSVGALVLGSSTPPVREVITDGENGLLYDFFDTDELAEKAIAALAEPQTYQPLRFAARQTILERYDLAQVCLPAWLKLIAQIANRPQKDQQPVT